jgi:hypothetical protein
MTTPDRSNAERILREVPELDTAAVCAWLDDRNRLTVRFPDGSERTNVRVVPAFPITRPHRFLYFEDEDGNELGLLVDPKGLNRESRELILDQADQVYFMPRITRIIRVDEQTTGVATWEVETDRGWSRFEMVPRSESVWYVGRDRVLIRDVDGNRYLIEDTNALDPRSRRWSELYL